MDRAVDGRGDFAPALSARGHKLSEGALLDFGAAQTICVVDHGYVAASESRRDGQAVGF